MFQVFTLYASCFFVLMTSQTRLKTIWRAIIPLTLLLSLWTFSVQAKPTRTSGLNQKFNYNLDASETPVFLPGQVANFICSEQISPDTEEVQWQKDGTTVGFTTTSKNNERRKTAHDKERTSPNSRWGRSRNLRSLKSTESSTQTQNVKATSATSRNFTESDFTVWKNGSLQIRNITRHHAGQYMCLVKDLHGKFLRRKFNVTIANLPQGSIQPSTQSVNAHQHARFYCSTNIPRQVHVTYSWTKDGKPVLDDHLQGFEYVPNGALDCYNLTPGRHAGSYRCHVTSSLGEFTSEPAVLNVLPQANNTELRFIIEPQNVTVFPPYDCAIFECLVNDPNQTYGWTKTPGKICINGCPPLTHKGNNLILNKYTQRVSDYGSGFFNCIVRPKNLPNGITRTAFLDIQEIPKVSLYPPTENPVLLSKSFQITCEASGNPQPKLSFVKDGDVLSNSNIKMIGGTLILPISNFKSNHTGYYQCIAENSVGANSVGFRLRSRKKEDVPPPIDVTATVISDSEIFVKWGHPPNADNILSYNIHYGPADYYSLSEDYPKGPSARNYTLEKLKAYTLYLIEVTSYTSKGASTPVTVEARTMESEPGTIRETDMNLSAVNSTAILLMWPSLPEAEQHGIVRKYKVAYARDDIADDDTGTVTMQYDEVMAQQRPDEDNPVTEYTLISGLIPAEKYIMSVTAATDVGYGLESVFWTVDLPKTEVKTCMSDSSESAFLYSTGYRVQEHKRLIVAWKLNPDALCSPQISVSLATDTGNVAWHEVDARNLSTVFTDIDTRKPYIVEILLYYPGDEVCETRSFAVVSEDKAKKAANFSWETAGRRCIRLRWDYEEDLGLDMYFVVRYDFNLPKEINYKYLNSTSHNAVVCDLEPWTPYEFAVAAVYSFETWSENTTFAIMPELAVTAEEEPGVPVNFFCSEHDLGKVKCSWEEPGNPYGIILSYTLLYQILEEEKWEKLNTTDMSAVVGCLMPESQPLFKVYATNSAGNGKATAVQTVAIKKYDSSKTNCTFPGVVEIDNSSDAGFKAIFIGVSIAVICIIICVLLLCFCLPGRQAKFALYRRKKKKNASQNNGSNKTDSLIHAPGSQTLKQNGYFVQNGYHVTDREALAEQQTNLLPKNGDAVMVPNGNGNLHKNGYKKHNIVKKNGFRKENSHSKMPNGFLKNDLRNGNGTGNSYLLDTLHRPKVEKRVSRAVPESDHDADHCNQRLILSVPIPKHCSKNNDTKSLDSDKQELNSSHGPKREVSFSHVDEIRIDETL